LRARGGRAVAAAALALAAVVGVAGCAGRQPTTVQRTDITPREQLMDRAVPAGVVETALASGSGDRSGRSELLWTIAVDTRRYDYPVASCENIVLGEAQGEGQEGGVVATARCDQDRYDVVVSEGQLVLQRAGEQVISFSLTRGMRVHVAQ
jgi:hypothetical protein